MRPRLTHLFFFFFNDTATTEIYTLSLHDALPISGRVAGVSPLARRRLRRLTGRCLNHWTLTRSVGRAFNGMAREHSRDRKSTRLNSSHRQNSDAGFSLKKKK